MTVLFFDNLETLIGLLYYDLKLSQAIVGMCESIVIRHVALSSLQCGLATGRCVAAVCLIHATMGTMGLLAVAFHLASVAQVAGLPLR